MVKANKNDRSNKHRPSSHKANATGYAKRHSLKAKTFAGHSDIYEYDLHSKTRRSKVALEIGRDEAAEIGLGWIGGDEEDTAGSGEDLRKKVRLIGEEDVIESGDDEDIDSDAAFEESDEERFAGFGRSEISRRSTNTDEDEEMEDGDSDEFIDALAVFDGESEEDDILVSASDDDEDPSPEALASLETFISTLDPSKKRKAPSDNDGPPADADAPPQTRKRRMIKERTEAGLENEFGAQGSGSTKLSLDDLLAPLASRSSNLLGLKKSAKVLASTSGAKTLSAPLPQRTQERVDREAAYEQTKEEVDKWSETMKRIKEAEHLSFPLQAQPVGRVSNLELAAKFKPTTELESSIDKLLKSAKMRDEDLQQTEQLAMNHLSVEEVATRRAELRKMRELMFRAEVKAKRVSKIKSKTYRRIKKKERVKLAKKVDGDEGEEDNEEWRLKREMERARERATLRHKSTGKWAKAMKAKGELDVDERREISEMLERGEQLRRKIRGDKGSDEDGEDGDDDDGEDGDDDQGLSRIKAGAFEELSQLNRDDTNEVAADSQGKKGTTIFEMKFMRDAMNRSQQRTHSMMDDFVKEMGSKEGEGGVEELDDERTGDSNGPAIQRTGGRAVYRPVPIPSTNDSNPWLTSREIVSNPSRKKDEIVVGKDSAILDKSKNKLKKQTKKFGEEKVKAKDDAVVEISMDDVVTFPSSEIEAQEMDLNQKGKGKSKGVKAFEQRELVARAFAGDNVVQAFEDAKQRETAEDAPRTVDTTIPGWGTWGGSGTRRQPTRPYLIKAVAGIDPSTRSDFNKKHVIISEKRDKKAAKYMVKDLPYPYTSKAQFERSIDTPLGAEWNTRVGFQRGTLPKVVKKMGTIIDPLEKLF